MTRHEAIVRWQDIEGADDSRYPDSDELHDISAPYAPYFAFRRLGIHHQRLLPGRRTSFPHAESTEDEFVFVLSGSPDVWLDGQLFRLGPGNGVGFPAGTGLSHSFLNNADGEVALIVVGERTRPDNRLIYPKNPERQGQILQRWWHDVPKRDLGPHDGVTDMRARRPHQAPEGGGHTAIVAWSDIENSVAFQHRDKDEPMSHGAAFGRHFGLRRLGIHHERLLPGRRTSLPHAESAEEEFVYVITGHPDVWLDGDLHHLSPGDAVGFPAGTGLAHSLINNTETDVRLLVIGEASKPENRIVYPLNPERKPLLADWWDDAPERPLGPHDGLSDLRRAELAKRV